MRPTTERHVWKLLSECQAVAELQCAWHLCSIFKVHGHLCFLECPSSCGFQHRLSQTVHCRPPGITIAGFFRFVLISEFTPFLQDLCFISHDGFKLDFPVFQETSLYRLLSLRDGATIKLPPPKTPSQSSQPSRIVARQGFNDSSERNRSDEVFGVPMPEVQKRSFY